MKFPGLQNKGTTVPSGRLCPKSFRPDIKLIFALLLAGWTYGSCNALFINSFYNFPRSVLMAGKHNTTPISGCTGYNPAKLTFTTPTSGGTPPYNYQWQLNNLPVAGETLSTYDPPQITAAGTYTYNCLITDAAGSVVFTDPKTIIIVPDPYVTISGGGTTCKNSSLTLTSTIINGTGTYSYQWESGPTASGPWTLVTDAISPEFSPATDLTGSVFYHLAIYPSVGSCNNALSQAIEVTVNELPSTSLIYHL